MTEPEHENRGGRVVVLTVLGLLVLFGGLYAAAYFFADGRVPRGASVAGIEIGGRTHDQAVTLLQEGFAERAEIAVTVDGKPATLDAAQLGLSVDVEATLEEAGAGRSWSPVRLWDHYTGGDDLEPVLVRDDDALEAGLVSLDDRFGTPPREGAVTFRGDEVRRTPGTQGKQVDRTTAADAVAQAYVDDSTAALDLVVATPEIDDADVQEAMTSFANPAVSGPVTLVFDKVRVRLQPADYTPALSLVPEGGELVPTLDEKRLTALIRRQIADSDGAPVNATVRIVDGRPQVVPDRPGIGYRPQDVNSTFLELVVAPPGRREKAVAATVQRAEFRTADARALNITEKVSSFTTSYPHAEYRNVNIGQAARNIDGTLLKPGETFSFNETVGERTKANGFAEGFIISDGILLEDYGGGVSQAATTTFNAMFFAGLEDVEHRPHSFYIDRYPVGREATVVWGALDLQFKNDTDHGVLITASIDPSTPGSRGSITVEMWSTKVWDITTTKSERYNFTQEETRRLSGPDCFDHQGFGGFDIDVFRHFRRPGSAELVRTEKFHTTYKPSDTVICRD